MSSCGLPCCTGRFKTLRNEANAPRENPGADLDVARYDGTYFILGRVRENGEGIRVMFPKWADLRRAIRNLLSLIDIEQVGQVGSSLSVEEWAFLDLVLGPGKVLGAHDGR